MKSKDLLKYKPLDITELPAEKWDTAEKVLGLDENDKVVMAEPDAVTYEEVEEAIDQAMATETARTESTYAKKGELPPLDDYYTKEETDAVVTSATQDMATETWVEGQGYLTEHQDLSAYAKTTAVTQDIQTAIASETARTEDVYAKKSDIPDLDNYYTKSETDEAIEEAISGISLEGYWTSAETKNYVDTEITAATASETARTESTYAKKTDVPSLDGYWTSAETQNAITAATEGLATEAWVTGDTETRIGTAIASETARTESTYAKKSEIPSLDGYATEAYVTAATEDMATKTWVENGYTPKQALKSYYTKSQTNTIIESATDDMATKTWVQNQGYLTQHQDISGKLDTSVFTAYTGATETVLEGKADISDIPDVSGFVTSGDVETQIGTAMAAETARTESTYLKEHQDISGKLDVSVFTGYTGTTETAINGKVGLDVYSAYTGSTATAIAGKVDNTTFTGYTGDTQTAFDGKVGLDVYSAYTGSTATAIAGKQDTLVSGTNIKTINNESLLGSGNIVIQGGGGGDNVVELTKAQYEALNPPAADTTYIITDAETVDLNDYAIASAVTAEITAATATKADKANVTARAASNTNSYIPGWNSQGIITGDTRIYSVSMTVNGTAQNNIFRSSNTALPSFYAPTSAGTAGQPLLSNGSGAPVWASVKFAFVSQSQYDALTTKDSSTIYFVIDPN